MTSGHTITLWCSRWRELRKYSALFQMKTKLVTQIFSSMIRSKKLYFLVMMIFYFTLKLYELFKCFRLYVSSRRYTHICSNHLRRSENNDTCREPQYSSDHIHQYV